MEKLTETQDYLEHPSIQLSNFYLKVYLAIYSTYHSKMRNLLGDAGRKMNIGNQWMQCYNRGCAYAMGAQSRTYKSVCRFFLLGLYEVNKEES